MNKREAAQVGRDAGGQARQGGIPAVMLDERAQAPSGEECAGIGKDAGEPDGGRRKPLGGQIGNDDADDRQRWMEKQWQKQAM